MDPHRKRRLRLVVALSAAVVLAGALVYTSFSASSEAVKPSELLRDGRPGQSYQLSGTVGAGRRREFGDSGRRAVYALAGVLTVAFGVLEIAFLRSDFSFDVVASHSSIATPTFYKAAAAWSSQEGSLLLWVWLLALWS